MVKRSPGELHAVTGVTREPDDDLLELLPRVEFVPASPPLTLPFDLTTLPFTCGVMTSFRVAWCFRARAAGLTFTLFLSVTSSTDYCTSLRLAFTRRPRVPHAGKQNSQFTGREVDRASANLWFSSLSERCDF